MTPISHQGRRVIAVFALLLPVARAYAQNPPSTAAPQPASVFSQDSKPNVVEVQLVTEDGKSLGKLPEHLPVQPGMPLDHRQVADSLRALYRTGDYGDLRAVLVPVEGALRLGVVARRSRC